ncbi:MAG: hypothetical protein IJ861_04535 [Clostridia bacterium]|nr:hypothetical protein [Clostridia bacterium]
MYKVMEIIEPDFGCEGLPDGTEPMCEVILEEESGTKVTVKVPDRELYQKRINEGDMIDYTNGIILKL